MDNLESGDPEADAALLIDQMRNSDGQVRLHAFSQLTKICEALGPLRTRDEFIPYLNEFIDDEDEILLKLAEQLQILKCYVGGKEYYYTLLMPLENLAGVEESVVRNKAVEVIGDLIASQSKDDLVKYGIPVLKRLATKEWYTSRMSACQLFHIFYPKVTDEFKPELRKMFVQLCEDEVALVRKTACSELKDLLSVVAYEDIMEDLYGPFVALSKDQQDSVRLLSVESCTALSRCFDQELQNTEKKKDGVTSTTTTTTTTTTATATATTITTTTTPKPSSKSPDMTKVLVIVKSLCKDKSWRVRHQVATHVCDIYKIVSCHDHVNEFKLEEMVDGFTNLLMDNEPEVRTAAASKLEIISQMLGGSKTAKKLITPVKTLVRDSSQFTRAMLASHILPLVTIVPIDDATEHLLPMLHQLLRDADPEVRLNVIEKLSSLKDIIPVKELASSLLPSIVELAADKKWRTRERLLECIPGVANQMGHVIFEQKLINLCMNFLGDQVFAIRKAATVNLAKLIGIFGVPWGEIHILPKVINLGSHKSFLYRMTALFAMSDLAGRVGPKLCRKPLLPTVLGLANDSVPNVKFNVCKTLVALLPHLDKTDQQKTQHVLMTLQQDLDPDVQHHAELALSCLETLRASKGSTTVVKGKTEEKR